MGFRKKIEIIPIKKAVLTGPTKDLKAERLDALIITNSEVRERLRYIANVDKRIINGRIRYIISGKFNREILNNSINFI